MTNPDRDHEGIATKRDYIYAAIVDDYRLDDEISPTELVDEIEEEYGVVVSVETVRRTLTSLAQLGLLYHEPWGPFVKDF